MASDRLRNDKVSLILLDTSGIIHALSRKIDMEFWFDSLVNSPYKLCVTRPVFEEIKKLSEGSKGKKRSLAKLSLKFLDKCEIIETDAQSADDSVLEAAIKYRCYVFTCDSKLKDRLKECDIRTFVISNDNRIVLAY